MAGASEVGDLDAGKCLPRVRLGGVTDDRAPFAVTAEPEGRHLDPEVDDVFASNDDFALLLIRALVDRGVEVPGDVAVIGCDNDLAGELIRPQLSTVDLGHAAAGVYLAVLLYSEITGTPMPEGLDAPEPPVVARAST